MVKRLLASKVVRIFGGVVIVYGLLGFFVLPWIIQGQAKSFLEKRLSIATSIDKVRLNPFALSFTVEGLDLIDADQESLIAFERFYLNFQLSSMFSGAANFKAIHLDGLNVTFHRYSETDSNLTRVAERWEQSSNPQEASDEEATGDSEIFPLQIQDFRLQEASFEFFDMVPSVPYAEFVDSINLNLENVSTLPQNSAYQSFTLAMSNGSKIKWTGTLSLAPISSSGQVELVGPYPELAYEYFGEQLPVMLRGGWFDASFDYRFELMQGADPQLSVSELEARLQDLDIREHSGALLASISSVSLDGGNLEWPANTFTAQDLSLDRFIVYPQRASDGQINFMRVLPEQSDDANVQASVASSEQAAPWTVSLASLGLNDWHIRFVDEVPQKRFVVDIGLDVALTDLSNGEEAQFPLTVNLDVDSQGSISLAGDLQVLPEPKLVGTLAIDTLSLGLAQAYVSEFARITLDDGALTLAGDINYSSQSSGFSGSVSLQDLMIIDAVQSESLFSLSALDVEGLTVDYGTELSVNVGEITLQEPYARVEIESDGSSNISRTLVASEELASTGVAESDETVSHPIAMTVQRILIDNASADFDDANLPLPFAVKMTKLGGEISALSTRSREPARIDIEGQVDEFGLATIKGELLPLAYAELTEIDLSFRNLTIPAMTPYVIKFAGRHIDDGHMDVDLSYGIHDGQMLGENTLVLRDLELGARQEHPGALDLPLGLAIALLKNADGVIDLNVPVTGDVNNPQFEYGAVISQALANIIRNIVASPFKLLAGLVGGGEDEEIGVISFVPGRSDLAPPEREKLLKLSQALAQRPQLALDVSGVYHVATDGAAMRSARVDERTNLALEVPAQSGGSAPTRTAVLERIYTEATSAEQVQQDLAAWREARTEQPTMSFDELAYAGDIRRALIAIEPISEADLEGLADARSSAVIAELTTLSSDLADRLQSRPLSVIERVEDGAVSLELELAPR